MPFFDEMGSWLRQLRVYLLGRGLLSIGMLVATGVGSFMGWPVLIPALMVAVGGTALHAMMRLNSQAIYEEKMVDLYRDDIAGHLHIPPQEVTRVHLKVAAQDNEVIAQALTRQRHKNIISFATSALASVVTLGLIYFALDPNAPGLIYNKVADVLSSFFSESGIAASLVKYLSIGIISGTSSLILHDGLEALIGLGSGVSKAAAHDLIVDLENDVKRGRAINPQQVYAVLVAGDPKLQQVIKSQFGHDYGHMSDPERMQVLDRIGVTAEMQQLTTAINRGTVHPGHLAYMIDEARDRAKQAPVIATASEPALTLPPPARGQFVERLGLAPREAAISHVARVEASRTQQELAV